MSRVWETSKQKANKLLVLLALADGANDDGWAYPSQAVLATKCRIGRRAVQKILDELESEGEVVIFNRRSGNTELHFSNVYHLAKYSLEDAPAPAELRGSLFKRIAASSEQPDTTVANGETPPSEQPDTTVANGGTHDPLLDPLPEPVVVVEVARPNIYRLVENLTGSINPLIVDDLKDAEKEYPAEWLPKAFKIAADQNKRSWAYVRGILENWRENGFEAPPRKASPNGKVSTPKSPAYTENIDPDVITTPVGGQRA